VSTTSEGNVGQRSAATPATEIDLKNAPLAALLAWLVPGLGHWYQGRRPKAVLFFICIMSTYTFGLYLGGGRVVYASARPDNRSWPYLCQVGVGLPAMPALVQGTRFKTLVRGGDKRFENHELRQAVAERKQAGESRLFDWFMAPPELVDYGPRAHGSELDQVHYHLGRFFELGSVYTMVAGLLNILVVFDAWRGPAYPEPPPEVEEKKKRGGGS